jgi:hypothetical protein
MKVHSLLLFRFTTLFTLTCCIVADITGRLAGKGLR